MNAVLSSIKQLEEAAVSELEELETKLDTKQFHASREKLYKRRQELASGKSQPTAEELVGFQAAEPGSPTHVPRAASVKGVPYFWLNVLCNEDTIAEELSSRDKQALAYCSGVRAVLPVAGSGPATLEFSFSSNPFFSNSVLRRCLGDEDAGVPELTTDIQWKDTAHKLTVKATSKKGGGGKKGKKGKGGKAVDDTGSAAAAASVRFKPAASFFRFFLPDDSSSSKRDRLHDPTALRADDSDDFSDDEGLQLAEAPVKSAKAQKDELIAALMLESVLPRATSLYLSGPLQVPSDEEDDEGGFQVVHGAASSPAELPGPVQAALHALQHNQKQLDELAAEFAAQRAKLQAAEAAVKSKLAEQRRALLFPAGSSSSTVPRFWLRVLRSADAAALAISSRDAAVLASLTDVRFSISISSAAAGQGTREARGRLELEFLPGCKHLAPDCTKLAKEYSFEVPPSGEPYLLSSRVAAAPAWASPALDPTHKPGRDGRPRPASSIFQLFKQGGGKYAFNLTGQDVQAEANELEVELLMELHMQLLLGAGSAYKQGAADGWPDDDTPAGDEAAWAAASAAAAESDEDEEGSSSSEDDEAEAAHKAAAKRSKAKAGGFKLTKGTVLVAFVALMLLAELFVFLDMAGLFK